MKQISMSTFMATTETTLAPYKSYVSTHQYQTRNDVEIPYDKEHYQSALPTYISVASTPTTTATQGALFPHRRQEKRIVKRTQASNGAITFHLALVDDGPYRDAHAHPVHETKVSINQILQHVTPQHLQAFETQQYFLEARQERLVAEAELARGEYNRREKSAPRLTSSVIQSLKARQVQRSVERRMSKIKLGAGTNAPGRGREREEGTRIESGLTRRPQPARASAVRRNYCEAPGIESSKDDWFGEDELARGEAGPGRLSRVVMPRRRFRMAIITSSNDSDEWRKNQSEQDASEWMREEH